MVIEYGNHQDTTTVKYGPLSQKLLEALHVAADIRILERRESESWYCSMPHVSVSGSHSLHCWTEAYTHAIVRPAFIHALRRAACSA